MTSPLADFIAGLPKAELHVHHVGSASPRIVAELAARHPAAGVPADRTAARRVLHLPRLPALHRGVPVGGRPDQRRRGRPDADLRGGPRHGRPADPVRGVDDHPVFVGESGYPGGGVSSRPSRMPGWPPNGSCGVVLRWCFDIPGEAGLPSAAETARIATELTPDGLISFGLGGPEIRAWPRPQFQPYFDQARAIGLHSVPHAGETTGPETIWDALRPARRRTDRARHLGGAGPGAAGLPGRAPDRPGGVPDLQRGHPRGAVAGRAPAARDGRGGRAGHHQLRRSADVLHRPQQRVPDRRRAAGLDRAGMAALAQNAVTASFAPDQVKARPAAPRSTSYLAAHPS